MSIPLDQAFFRQLIWLYVVATMTSLVAMIPEFVGGRWHEFSLSFDALVDQHFGPYPDSRAFLIVALLSIVVCLLWHILSIVGLFRFSRWARSGFWLSMLATFGVLAVSFGLRPIGYGSVFDLVFEFFGSAAFGAIVVLSYGKGLGADWFAPHIENARI